MKIDPKSIGVGQYQHDIAEFRLSKALDAVVEDCVNAVGVEVNTASAKLLARVSGLGESLAQNIVAFRDAEWSIQVAPATAERTASGAEGFRAGGGVPAYPRGR